MASVPSTAFQFASIEQLEALTAHRRSSRKGVVRRRPSREQGRSLEILGHAIEYLVDTELQDGPSASLAGAPHAREILATQIQATQILSRLSREVFADCPEIVPFWRAVLDRMHRVFRRDAHPIAPMHASGPRH